MQGTLQDVLRAGKRIYDMAATERLLVMGYHTSFPSLGFVQRAGSAYRWLPLTYQLQV